MQALLQYDGQEVDVAESGTAALERLCGGGRGYDAILCDVGMPGLSGWDVARSVQQLAPGTPVYLLTGWALEIPPDDPRRQWIRGVLAKPIDPPEIRTLLATLTP
jgi:CheY-like chemotaxis protein